MIKTKKKLLFLVVGVAFLVSALVLAAGVIAIQKIDPETRIKYAVAEFSKKMKGTAAFEAFELKFIPRPRLVFRDVNISVPGITEVFIRQLTLYPDIISLFRGKLRVSRLTCDFVQSAIHVDRLAPDNTPVGSGLPVKEIMGRMASYPALLAKKFPGLRVAVHQGKIDFIGNDKPIAWLSNVNADIRLSPEKARLDIGCRSSLWQRADLAIDMDFQTLKTACRMDFDNLQVDSTPENILFFKSYRLARLSADLHATGMIAGSDTFSGKISGSAPVLEIRKSGQKAVQLHCSRIKGDFFASKNMITAKLDQLVLTRPQAVLAGRFKWNKVLPKADMEINGSVMDVETARGVALELVGQFRTTQKIFEFVRGGVVPRISFTAVGDTPGDFKKAENTGLQGHLIHGKIVIPKQDLHLDEASGEVVLSRGILAGKNIRARMGNSYARQGEFSIGMIGRSAPYHLETQIEADLVQLPPVLTRLIHNKTFKDEMMRLSNVSGRATGKLVLGDRKDRIKPRVEVDGFHLSMNYDRVPLTFHLAGEKFLYDNHRIDIHNITGTVGKNAISGVDAAFDWQHAPSFFCRSKSATLIAEEITPWLKSLAGLSPVFGRVDSAKGRISLTQTQIEGPFLEPAKWRFKASGKITNLAVGLSGPPGPFEVVRGQFHLDPGQLDISNALVRNPDGELAGSLNLTGGLSRLSEIHAQFNGKAGGRTLQLAFHQSKLPLEIHEDASWAISEGELTHCPGKTTVFKGVAAVLNGPSLALDVHYETGALSVNKLHIKDNDTDASFSLHRHGYTYDIDFAGHFYSSTLENIFAESPVFPGALAGDFTLHIETDHPGNARFDGQAEISDFPLPSAMGFPITIQKASLTQNSMDHKASGSFLWDGNLPFSIDGKLESTQHKVAFDVSLFSEKVDVDSLIRRIRQSRQKKAKIDNSRFWEPNIYGNIDIHANQVKYTNHTWSPVKARASLSPDQIRIEISEALLCGFDTPGIVLIKPKTIDLRFQLGALNQQIEKTLPCFGGKNGLIQGNMDVVGNVSAKGAYDSLLQSVNGNFNLTAKNGRIFRFGLLAKIFSILNITEIYRGTLPDLTQEGFKYSAITADGEIKGPNIIISRALIDGASMDIVLNGEIAYKKKTMDIDLLVAPFKTIDSIVKNTPLVNDVLSGTLVSIPFKVQGDISNAEVTILEPPSIGGGLLRIIENTLKIPVKIIQPILKGNKENKNGVKNNTD